MATTKIGVEIDLDPSGVQRGAAAAAKAVDGLGESGKGLNKLDNAFKGLGEQALGLPGPLGRVADALLDFAPGGLVGAGVIAGIGAIAFAFKEQQKRQEDLLKANDEARKANEDLRLSYIRLQTSVEDYNKAVLESSISTAKQEVVRATTELANYFEEVDNKARAAAARMVTARGFAGEAGGAATRGQADLTLEERIAAQRNSILSRSATERIELETKVANAQTALNNAVADQRDDNAKRAADASKSAAKAAIDAENARKKALQDALTEYQRVYELQQAGLPLTAQQQDLLNTKTEEYKLTLFDLNKPLEERIQALQLLSKIESDRQRILDEAARKEKERLDAQKEQEKKALDDAKERVNALEPFIMGGVSALETMTQAIMQGDNAFKAFGDSARAAITDILRALARQNIVEGLGALAKGFAAAANPLTAVSAGGFFKAATQHFAAAAAAGVGAAAIGGAGAAGGRGSSFGLAGQGFNQSQLGNVAGEQGALFITIEGGSILDMSNPETAKAFARALQTATNRRIVFSGA